MARPAKLGVALGLAAAVAAAPGAARAVDAFEIQVYDGTANPPRTLGLELHTNVVASGLATAPPPEAPSDHQAHFTLEPSFGVTPAWELGGYLQTALRADGGYEYAGVKLRSKLVTPPAWSSRGRLGLNLEVSDVPRRYEAEGWGLEVRPIAAWDFARVSLAANPIVGVSLTDGTTSFEPAVQALFVAPGVASVGLEYYADLGPVLNWSAANAQQHYLYEVANLLAVRRLEVNLGVGEGFTAASNPLVVKLIVGWTFERTR
jgi:hypothetical protein